MNARQGSGLFGHCTSALAQIAGRILRKYPIPQDRRAPFFLQPPASEAVYSIGDPSPNLAGAFARPGLFFPRGEA